MGYLCVSLRISAYLCVLCGKKVFKRRDTQIYAQITTTICATSVPFRGRELVLPHYKDKFDWS